MSDEKDRYNPNNPVYQPDPEKQEETTPCLICFDAEEPQYLADVMVFRRIHKSILRVNMQGNICETCKEEKSNYEDGTIIRTIN